jgi:hypothetical protein
MTGKWYLNGSDLYTTYGAAIMKGSYNDLLLPPTPRKRLEYEFLDQNGLTVDTTSPLKYQAKRFKMQFALKASSDTQFWTRYNALFTALAISGTVTLQIVDLNKTFTLLYEGTSKVDKLTKIAGATMVFAAFEINFLQPIAT